jgi:hypothetical protein
MKTTVAACVAAAFLGAAVIAVNAVTARERAGCPHCRT